jgi:hypothetical protein
MTDENYYAYCRNLSDAELDVELRNLCSKKRKLLRPATEVSPGKPCEYDDPHQMWDNQRETEIIERKIKIVQQEKLRRKDLLDQYSHTESKKP